MSRGCGCPAGPCMGRDNVPGVHCEARATRTLTVQRDEMSRSVRLLVDGEEVGQTDYDETSWAGLELLERVGRALAARSGWRLVEEDWDRYEKDG